MPDKFIRFLILAVFSGLSMNLVLRFGIGLRRIASDDGPGTGAAGGAYGGAYGGVKTGGWVFVVRTGIYFASVLILWLFFSLLRQIVFLGFFEYVLVFPVSSLFFTVMRYVAGRLIIKTDWRGELVSRNNFLSGCFFIEDPKSADCGATGGAAIGAALFVTLGLAGGFAQAATLSFGFAAGAALAVLITGGIRRRSATEAVPPRLRGGPLVLITMGLLSLVFTSVAVVFYAVLGAN